MSEDGRKKGEERTEMDWCVAEGCKEKGEIKRRISLRIRIKKRNTEEEMTYFVMKEYKERENEAELMEIGKI